MKEIIELHKFFIKQSREYKTTYKDYDYDFRSYRIKDIKYYPIAYIKFMYYSLIK